MICSAARKYVLQGLTMEIDAFVLLAAAWLCTGTPCAGWTTDWSAAEPHATMQDRGRCMCTREIALLAWLACAPAGKTEIYFSILSVLFPFRLNLAIFVVDHITCTYIYGCTVVWEKPRTNYQSILFSWLSSSNPRILNSIFAILRWKTVVFLHESEKIRHVSTIFIYFANFLVN